VPVDLVFPRERLAYPVRARPRGPPHRARGCRGGARR
jgi:hypothetical protein